MPGGPAVPGPLTPTGKDLLESLFLFRSKCALCEKAGVYEQVAGQLAKSVMNTPPHPVPPAWHVVRTPRKNQHPQFQASPASSPMLDPSFPLARASSQSSNPKAQASLMPRYIPTPSLPMPANPPSQASTTFWLASCVPDWTPEALEWDASEIPRLTNYWDDHRELHSVLLDEDSALCAICQVSGLLLQDA